MHDISTKNNLLCNFFRLVLHTGAGASLGTDLSSGSQCDLGQRGACQLIHQHREQHHVAHHVAVGKVSGLGCHAQRHASLRQQGDAEGLLDEAEYSFAKKSYDEQYADLSRRLDEAVQRRSKFNEAMSVDNKWITLMKSVSTATQLTQDLVDESVELVKVHEGGAVELVMKYGDIYELTIQSIKEVQEAM